MRTFFYHQDLQVPPPKTLQTGLPPLGISVSLQGQAHCALFVASWVDQMINLKVKYNLQWLYSKRSTCTWSNKLTTSASPLSPPSPWSLTWTESIPRARFTVKIFPSNPTFSYVYSPTPVSTDTNLLLWKLKSVFISFYGLQLYNQNKPETKRKSFIL